jgi:hypothetical protein
MGTKAHTRRRGRVIAQILRAVALTSSVLAWSVVASQPAATPPLPRLTTRNAAVTRWPAYWLAARDGGVFSLGLARFYGSAGGIRLNSPVVGMAATPDGGGYWLVAADGGIFSYGNAGFFGSTGAMRLNAPIVGMAPTASGAGYWLVASDGGIFSFGDAAFFGSTGGMRLNKPVVGMAATADGRGYWLVASDGGIFAFGDAGFLGSTGGTRLNQPVVGMAASPDGDGYWLVASDGGIFAFGHAAFFGSTGGIKLNKPVVGMTASVAGGGYWLVASDGGIFAFGDAPYRGSMGGARLNAPVVGMARTWSVNPYPPGGLGFDISWPQCGGSYPPSAPSIAIVGVNGGRPFTHNPCFSSELAWAGPAVSLYVNTDFPDSGRPEAMAGPAGNCAADDMSCQAYNFGYNAATDAYTFATGNGARAQMWWLDVETKNDWPADTTLNARAVAGYIAGLQAAGVSVGIYGTGFQWNKIAGSYAPGLPIWVAGAQSQSQAPGFCDPAKYFAGGIAWLAQYPNPPYDGDYGC